MRSDHISPQSERQHKRILYRRMLIIHGIFFIALLVIIARLLDLQVLKGNEYRERAESQHYGGIVLPARRGEILALNSKTGERSILATNITLDLVYVDPVITDNPAIVAETLADILVTPQVHGACSHGDRACPQELIGFYQQAFDPLLPLQNIRSNILLERLTTEKIPPISEKESNPPDITEVRRRFARDIERRISGKRLTFVPLKYGASKVAMRAVEDMRIPGIKTVWKENLIYADPEDVDQSRLSSVARSLSPHVEMDSQAIVSSLRSRPLRYVPIMRQLPSTVSLAIKEKRLEALKETQKKREMADSLEEAKKIHSWFRSVALIPEHRRYYPDGNVASHVVGFLNTLEEAQYGIERTYDPVLRGQAGLIRSVSDPQGGQILRSQQTIVEAKDGDTVILSIDRTIQKETERILAEAVERYAADSGQIIIMNPKTGRIIALANAPLFDSNAYGEVFRKTPIIVDNEKDIVVEMYHPETNVRIVKAYLPDIFTGTGRAGLSESLKASLLEMERLYDLNDLTRYYTYLGENHRHEIFPTELQNVWLKYENNIGIGGYLNRATQEIYEPGSVLKSVTMAIALDQGEVTPMDLYEDTGSVQVDEYTIRNAGNRQYGEVTMVNCLEFSINTCMTSVSMKLGKKLFYRTLQGFGFGQISGIELEDELPGELRPWRKWSQALLATSAYGQGISATPLQVVAAVSALANGGRLMRPHIIDAIQTSNGETIKTPVEIVDQVIKPETADTITAMLVSAVSNGYARTAKVRGYRIAGKTGTSQIAGPGGKYETGTGSSIASFIGYAPANNPKFAMLVKIDRPRNVQHGSESAAPVFKEIATFLFKYYGIPPDDL